MKRVPSEVRSAFGSRLRQLRTDSGYDQVAAFATKLSIEEIRYSRFERGEVEPGLATLLDICDVLKTDPNTLLDY